MRIVTLENSGRVYTCEVYLVLGGASRLDDVNTLVDVGQDQSVSFQSVWVRKDGRKTRISWTARLVPAGTRPGRRPGRRRDS